MTNTIGIMQAYIHRYFLQWFAWRSFAFTLVANQTVTPLVSFAVWATAVPGLSYLSTYYVAILVVKLMTVSYENHTFSTRIFSGDLQDDFLRPHPVILQPLAENIAVRLWHVIIGLPIFICLALFSGLHTTFTHLIWAIPAVIMAAVLQFLVTYTLALSAFWTEQSHGIVGVGQLLTTFLGGEAVPLAFMPSSLQLFAKFLPFHSMIGFPAEMLAGTGSTWIGITMQMVWIVIFIGIVRVVWTMGVQRYAAVGA